MAFEEDVATGAGHIKRIFDRSILTEFQEGSFHPLPALLPPPFSKLEKFTLPDVSLAVTEIIERSRGTDGLGNDTRRPVLPVVETTKPFPCYLIDATLSHRPPRKFISGESFATVNVADAKSALIEVVRFTLLMEFYRRDRGLNGNGNL